MQLAHPARPVHLLAELPSSHSSLPPPAPCVTLSVNSPPWSLLPRLLRDCIHYSGFADASPFANPGAFPRPPKRPSRVPMSRSSTPPPFTRSPSFHSCPPQGFSRGAGGLTNHRISCTTEPYNQYVSTTSPPSLPAGDGEGARRPMAGTDSQRIEATQNDTKAKCWHDLFPPCSFQNDPEGFPWRGCSYL